MEATLFYITNTLLLLTLIGAAMYISIVGRKVNDEKLHFSRRSYIAFYIALAVTVATTYDIRVRGGVEIVPTLQICMIYVSYVFLTMTATAYFGKKYYRNTFIWFSLLEFALLALIYNIIWRICGFYRHIMADDRPLNKVIHDLSMLRLSALILVLICCGFCTAVNIHSWRHYRRYNGEIRHSQDRRHLERSQSFIWRFIAVLHLYLFSYILPFLSLRILVNLLIAALAAESIYLYIKRLERIRHKGDMARRYWVIEQAITRMMDGQSDSPLLRSNTTLDEIADRLAVNRDDLSQYINERLGMNFNTWMRDVKVSLCARLLRTTDKNLTEIALEAGYNNVQAMHRAFRSRFGVTPSLYRKQRTDSLSEPGAPIAREKEADE